jgi:hypothetical protein
LFSLVRFSSTFIRKKIPWTLKYQWRESKPTASTIWWATALLADAIRQLKTNTAKSYHGNRKGRWCLWWATEEDIGKKSASTPQTVSVQSPHNSSCQSFPTKSLSDMSLRGSRSFVIIRPDVFTEVLPKYLPPVDARWYKIPLPLQEKLNRW